MPNDHTGTLDTGQMGKALILDHLDSFTGNIADSMARAGFEPLIQPFTPCGQNQDAPTTTALKARIKDVLGSCSALVLSPGPGHPSHYDTAWLRDFLLGRMPELPVLGICLGHQTLLWWDGMQVSRCPTKPVHGRTVSISGQGCDLPQPFGALAPSSIMVSYNSLGVSWQLAQSCAPDWMLVPSADSIPIVSMAVHRSRPWMGVQYHPESFASQCGPEFFGSFAAFCAQKSKPAARPSLQRS